MRLRCTWMVLLISTMVACARTPVPIAGVEPVAHYGDAWFAYRAKGLGISEGEARARDERLSEAEPPLHWDTQLATEATALWQAQCSRCHGPRGNPEDATAPASAPEARPRRWGTLGAAMGFFFGGDAMRAGVYKKIRDGQGSMPAWGHILSREQMWALVTHIEDL